MRTEHEDVPLTPCPLRQWGWDEHPIINIKGRLFLCYFSECFGNTATPEPGAHAVWLWPTRRQLCSVPCAVVGAPLQRALRHPVSERVKNGELGESSQGGIRARPAGSEPQLATSAA